MKRSFLLTVHIFLGFKLCSQVLTCDLIENYPALRFAEHFHKRADYFFQGDSIFLFDAFNMLCFSKTEAAQSYDLEHLLPKEDRKLIAKEYNIKHFFDGRIVVLHNKNNAFIFDYLNNTVKFRQRIRLSENYCERIFRSGSTLYFYGIYNYNPHDSQLPSGFISYNLQTGKEEMHKIPFSYLSLTHMAPSNFMDFTQGNYMVCDPLRYRIYEYNLDHTIRDSITAPDSLFTRSNTHDFTTKFKAEDLSQHASDYLDDMSSYLSTIDRIWTVYYIDENTIFVRLTRNSLHTTATENQLFYDHIWVRKKEGWHLSQVKEISSFRTTTRIHREDLWPYFLPGSQYTCNNGSLYYTVWSSGENSFPQSAHRFFGFETRDRNELALKLIRFRLK